MRKFKVGLFAAAASALSLAGPAVNAATVLYDSGGFSAPRFVANSALETQDGGKWQVFNNDPVVNNIAATVIQSAVPTDQIVALSRGNTSPTNKDGFWFVSAPYTYSPANNVVNVDWQMRVASPHTGLPFFGIQSFSNAAGAVADQIGTVGIDAGTGDLLIASSSGTNEFGGVGGFHAADDTWHAYHVAFDFTAQSFQIFVDGNQIGNTWGFQNAALTFSDADLHTYDTSLPVSPTTVSSGLAYFDDYKITTTPEPSAFALVGLVAPALMRRRRR